MYTQISILIRSFQYIKTSEYLISTRKMLSPNKVQHIKPPTQYYPIKNKQLNTEPNQDTAPTQITHSINK